MTFRLSVIWVLAALLLLGYWLLILQVGGQEPYSKEVFFSQGIDLISFRSCISSAVPIMIGYLVGSYIDQPNYHVSMTMKLVGVGIAMTLVGGLWSQSFPIIKVLLWSSSYVVFSVGFSIVAFAICLWVIEGMGMKSWAIGGGFVDGQVRTAILSNFPRNLLYSSYALVFTLTPNM